MQGTKEAGEEEEEEEGRYRLRLSWGRGKTPSASLLIPPSYALSSLSCLAAGRKGGRKGGKELILPSSALVGWGRKGRAMLTQSRRGPKTTGPALPSF